MEGLRLKKPKTLRELVDQERGVLADRADELAYADPSTTLHAIEIGKYRGVKEFLDRIEDMMKPTKEDDDEK